MLNKQSNRKRLVCGGAPESVNILHFFSYFEIGKKVFLRSDVIMEIKYKSSRFVQMLHRKIKDHSTKALLSDIGEKGSLKGLFVLIIE